MHDASTDPTDPGTQARPAGLIARLDILAGDDGYAYDLGDRHAVAFIERSTTLFVSFETFEAAGTSPTGLPLGVGFAAARGHSSLTFLSQGQTWFRDDKVYAHIDRMIDDGIFDEFDKVVFYGAGAEAYAATAFSVAAPGATVLALQPQATQNPEKAPWDRRFPAARRGDFTTRFGYAPQMAEAARAIFVLYDPRRDIDAMHASLFAGPNATHLRLPFLWGDVQARLNEMDILDAILDRATEGTLAPDSFWTLYRARRQSLPYLRRLKAAVDTGKHPLRTAALCAYVADRFEAPQFARRLDEIFAELTGQTPK